MQYFENIREHNSLFSVVKHTKELKNDFACKLEIHIQPTIEMVYVSDGRFDLHINGCIETIHTGEIGIVFPFQPHGYERYSGSNYIRFDFESELAMDFFNLKHNVIGEKSVFIASEVTQYIIKKYFTESNNFSKFNIQSLLYSALADFIDQVKLVPLGKDDNVLIKAITYVRANMDKSLQMNAVAKALGYSESYFSRALNKTAGFGFNTLLAMIRIESAKKLLRETDKTILEIVLECGFGSERSFYRQFKDITGDTPLKYRNVSYQ